MICGQGREAFCALNVPFIFFPICFWCLNLQVIQGLVNLFELQKDIATIALKWDQVNLATEVLSIDPCQWQSKTNKAERPEDTIVRINVKLQQFD